MSAHVVGRIFLFWVIVGSWAQASLFEEIASHEYEKREEATQKLILQYRAKKEALPLLLGKYRESADPEVKIRLKKVIKSAYITAPKGFLGIMMTIQFDQEEKTTLVKIDLFIKPSAAEKAGMLKNDLILAVDGKSIAGDEKQTPINKIHELVFSKQPGDKILVTVKRSGKKQKIEVPLGLHRDQELEFESWWEKIGNKKS